jgi:hypothetical protein
VIGSSHWPELRSECFPHIALGPAHPADFVAGLLSQSTDAKRGRPYSFREAPTGPRTIDEFAESILDEVPGTE